MQLLYTVTVFILFVISVASKVALHDEEVNTKDCSAQYIPNGIIKENSLGPSQWNWTTFRNERASLFTAVPLGSIPSRDAALYLFCYEGYSFQGSGLVSARILCSQGKWSPDPVCTLKITCPEFRVYRGLEVAYTIERKIGSIATFHCTSPDELTGRSTTEYLSNGTWAHPQPKCEKDCSAQYIPNGIIMENSQGPSQFNWTAIRYERASLFTAVPLCSIPSRDVALYLFCYEGYTFQGRGLVSARIQCSQGKWSPDPVCILTAGCYIKDLAESLPEPVVAKLEGVEEELLPIGSEVTLHCVGDMVLTGSKKSTCNESGSWQYGNLQCIRGCEIEIDSDSSRLIIEPSKQYYRLGEVVVLTCPPGLSLTTEVERIVCLGNRWSDHIPNCGENTKKEEAAMAKCPDPGYVRFAERTILPGSTKMGSYFLQVSVIQYRCQAGFEQMGVGEILCMLDGTWSSMLPSCIKVATVIPDHETQGLAVIADEGIPVRIMCPPERVDDDFMVWGTSIYRVGSSVCQAAIHSSKITSNGGAVIVINNGPDSDFMGSHSNNIETESYQGIDNSFRFTRLESSSLISNAEECVEGLMRLKNTCVYVSNLLRNYEDVKAVCTNLGLHLELPVDPEERLRLVSILYTKGIQSIWADDQLQMTTDEENRNTTVKSRVTSDDSHCPVVIVDELELKPQRKLCKDALNYVCIWKPDAKSLAVCRDPGPIANGTSKAEGENDNVFYIGSSIEYSCHTLHYLKGQKNISCTANGTWSAKKPECIKVDACEDPPIPQGGLVTYLPLKTGSAQRSAVHQSSRVVRLPSGIATPMPRNIEIPITLEPVDVPLPPNFSKIGTRAKYECESRYYNLIGSRMRRCQRMGKWTGRLPVCMPVCGRSNSPRSPFIVNGNASNISQWPWQAGIARHSQNYNRQALFCGASLVNEIWVITAAHCITYPGTILAIEPEEFKVYLGKYYRSHSKDDEYVQVRKIREIHMHPDFDPVYFDADIALIQLDEPVQLNSRVQPVCLPTEMTTRDNLVEGMKGVVTGWGMNENDKFSETLQQAVLPVVTQSTCERGYEHSGQQLTVTENMFCAGYEEGQYDACSGDSGGPMVFADDSFKEKRWVLEGIVSWGSPRGCGMPEQYGGFTRVGSYLDWIHHYV